jgi:hypothetical protein
MHDLPARAQAALSHLQDSSLPAPQRIEAAWEQLADCDLTAYPERVQPALARSLSILEQIATGPEDEEPTDPLEALSEFTGAIGHLLEFASLGEELAAHEGKLASQRDEIASLDRQIQIAAEKQRFLIGVHLLDGKGSKSVAHRLRDLFGSKRQALETVRAVDQDLRSRFGKDYAKLPAAERRALEDDWRLEFGYSEGLDELWGGT